MLYKVADRYDVKQYRELYSSPAAIAEAKAGKPLPTARAHVVQYKAVVDAQGNPVKDAKGRFQRATSSPTR